MKDVCGYMVLLAMTWAALAVGVVGQVRPGQELATLVRGNESLGRLLLERLYTETPHRNVAVSPISVALILAALQEHAEYDLRREVGEATGWGASPNLAVASRMLVAAFEKPESPAARQPQDGDVSPLAQLSEAAWISNTVLYRGTRMFSDRFIGSAEKYFGMTFASTGDSEPSVEDMRRSTAATGPLPEMSSRNDVLVRSGTHLRTAWQGNTFSLSKPFQGQFETASGQSKLVEMLRSEVASYWYGKTDEFEAVVLPCNRAYMLAVLPTRGRDLSEFLRQLAASLDAVDAVLNRQRGSVTLPPFRIRMEAQLRPHLEGLGVRRVFEDLGTIFTIPGSRFTEINQTVDIEVDKLGIRADAETVGGAIYGGIMGTARVFSLELNRPFVFLIRDSTTNALLFLGVVVDPASE